MAERLLRLVHRVDAELDALAFELEDLVENEGLRQAREALQEVADRCHLRSSAEGAGRGLARARLPRSRVVQGMLRGALPLPLVGRFASARSLGASSSG